VDEDLTDSTSQTQAHHAFWLRHDGAMMQNRQWRWSSWRRPDEFLQEPHMEHVMDFGARRQLEANGDRVDHLEDAVWPEEAGLQLSLGDLGQRRRRAVAEAEEHPIAHSL
jgi:hypothetical protein